MGRIERRMRAASRRRWAILGAAVALVAVGLWFAGSQGAMPGVVLLPEPARAQATLLTTVAVEAAVARTPAAVPELRGSGRVELCGVGWVEASTDATFLDPAVFAQVPGIDESRNALLTGLRDSTDAFERAVALVLDMSDPVPGATDPVLLEQLAQQAVTTDDARVYALAFRTCTRTPQQGSCARLSAAQWARLDEGNAAPWLFVLDEAAARGDRALGDEALYRIGSAIRYEDRLDASAGIVAAHAGRSDSDLVAAQMLATHAMGISAAMSAPLQRFTGACAASALADANRRQACDAAATTLGERSDSMLIAMIGAAVGRRLGWSLDRLVAIRAQRVALSELLSSDSGAMLSFGVSYSCDSVRSTLARLTQIAKVGGPQAARTWMTTSGKPYESYAAIAREQEARRSVTDAENASGRTTIAASAASAAQ